MRVYAGIAVVVTLIIGAVIVLGSVFPDLMRSSDAVRGRLLPATNAAIELRVIEADLYRTMRTWTLQGDTSALSEHLRLRTRADDQLRSLADHVGRDGALLPIYGEVESRHDDFIVLADDVIQLRTSGQVTEALDLAFSDQAVVAFEAMARAAERMRDALFEERDREVDELHQRLLRLGGTLISVAAILLVLTIILYITLKDWVLSPLERLRDQMRVAARSDGHETPIEPSGPPELANVGRDAEHLRRKLVEEIDEARAAREALGQDAPGVAAIRRELMPDLADPKIDGLHIHGVQQPAHGVLAGDWWDCIRLGDGRLAVCVADVAGHGPKSGIAALRIKHILNLVLSIGGSPAQAMRRIAETFEEEQSLFATAFTMTVNPETGAVIWANAGHVPPLLVRSADGTQHHLEPTGPLLSTLGGEWINAELILEPGDTVLIPTDGLIEAHDDSGEILGEAGFAQIEQTNRAGADGDIVDLVSRMIATIREGAVDWGRDDATLVGVRRAR
jgi:serine phosphatase RsbU (regulator of sigma subunit)/CHASE3 domain sensor protein